MDPNAVMVEAAKSANVDGRDGNRRAPPNLTPKTRWICIYRYIIRQSAFRYVYSLAQTWCRLAGGYIRTKKKHPPSETETGKSETFFSTLAA